MALRGSAWCITGTLNCIASSQHGDTSGRPALATLSNWSGRGISMIACMGPSRPQSCGLRCVCRAGGVSSIGHLDGVAARRGRGRRAHATRCEPADTTKLPCQLQRLKSGLHRKHFRLRHVSSVSFARGVLDCCSSSLRHVTVTAGFFVALAGCDITWLPGAAEFQDALQRLGFRPPALRASPRDVLRVTAPTLPGAAPCAQTPAGGTPGPSPSPATGSSQRPRRGRRGVAGGLAGPADPAVPLLNLRLLLRSIAAVLRRGKVGCVGSAAPATVPMRWCRPLC